MKNLVYCVFLMSAHGAGVCQQGSQQHVVALKAARMLDVAAGKVVSPGLVVITSNRISAVGGAVPSGVEVVELGDVTLMPGMIDAHVHLFCIRELRICRRWKRAYRSER